MVTSAGTCSTYLLVPEDPANASPELHEAIAAEEVLRPSNGQAGIRVHGRAVHFWRRERDGTWRIVRLLTGRSAPEEPEG